MRTHTYRASCYAVLGGFPLSESNRPCKPRHVLQRPPENNTCLHTVSSHNALPTNNKLVPFRFLSLAHVAAMTGISSFFPPFSSSSSIASCIRATSARSRRAARVKSPLVRACPWSALSQICGDPWVPSRTMSALFF